MTTIAATISDKKIVLAADSITVVGTTQVQKTLKRSKLFKGSDCIVAGTGYASETSLLELYCKDHNIGSGGPLRVLEFLTEFANWKDSKSGEKSVSNSYLIGHKSGLFQTNGLSVFEVDTFVSDGHGMDYALTALHLGYSARESIEISCEIDVFSQLPVRTLELKF